MENKISIIVVGKENIENTIESINNEIYKNKEIYVLGKENKNILKKSNNKIEFFDNFFEIKNKIKGDYVSIIKSGDYVGVDYYRQMIDKSQDFKADIIMGNTVFDIKGNKIIYNLLNSSIPDYLTKKDINNFIKNESLLKSILLFTGNKIFSTSLFLSCIEKNKNDDINDLAKKLLMASKELYKFDIDAIFHIVDKQELRKNEKNFYYSVKSGWNASLENIKKNILREDVKYVSFDVFDTLVLRPFLDPVDEFSLLNDKFSKMYKNQICGDFQKIRIESEIYARSKKEKTNQKFEDVTLDEIYDALVDLYGVDKKDANELKKAEIANEIKFCTRRKTAFQIYKFVRYINKKAIITSDMYLSKDTIKSILDNCGYTEIYKYFVSSEIGLTKAKGTLYKYVIKKLRIEPKNIIHIGDNWTSDWKNARDNEINSEFLPRTINMFYESDLSKVFSKALPFNEDNIASTNFMLIRFMLAEVANNYFDNPFKLNYDKNHKAIFNNDVKLFGYCALGMHLFGLTKWILDDMSSAEKPYDKINFLARDGYVPIKAYNIMKKIYNKEKVAKAEYFYISRKALIPIIFANETNIDAQTLVGSVNIFNHTPVDILKYLDWSIKYDEKDVEKICKKLNINKDESFENIYTFTLFLKEVRKRLLNKNKVEEYTKKLNEYFNKNFEGKACVFDIGYSARDEAIISKFINKPVDAYFINVNEQSSYYNARKWNFKIKTFLNYKPTIDGSIREVLISKQAPSCIRYDCSGKKVKPAFEEYKVNIDSGNIVNIIQNESVKFLKNLVDTFGKILNNYEYYNYYTNLALDAFINSPEKNDKLIIKMINFEDDVGMGNSISMNKYLDKTRKLHNQHSIDSLLDENDKDGIIVLDKESRKRRAVYYALFRHDIFKRRVKEIWNNIIEKITFKG